MDWKTNLEKELRTARAARAAGNEGQARVCARRAAGVIIAEFFNRKQWPYRNLSAIELIKALLEFPDLPVTARYSAELLLMRVNAEFDLPVGVDLVSEVEYLAKTLLSVEKV